MKLTAIKDTWLKARILSANELKDDQKEFLKAGQFLEVAAVSPFLEKGHLKITLGKDSNGNQLMIDGLNTLYVFAQHVDYSLSKKTSDRGIDLIKHFESMVLTAYPDPGTQSDPWTIGYGHTGADVYPGLIITEVDADRLLKNDLKVFESAVAEIVKVDLKTWQFDALVSFAFNCGSGALESSTLLRKVNNHLFNEAANEFLRWDRAADRVMPGLTRRRQAERLLFIDRPWKDIN